MLDLNEISFPHTTREIKSNSQKKARSRLMPRTALLFCPWHLRAASNSSTFVRERLKFILIHHSQICGELWLSLPILDSRHIQVNDGIMFRVVPVRGDLALGVTLPVKVNWNEPVLLLTARFPPFKNVEKTMRGMPKTLKPVWMLLILYSFL